MILYVLCVCACLVVSRYFFKNGKGDVDAHQGGVFRVNCMDSLDRTNVVQSMLARRILQKQLLVRPHCLPPRIVTKAHQPCPPHITVCTLSSFSIPHITPLLPVLKHTH